MPPLYDCRRAGETGFWKKQDEEDDRYTFSYTVLLTHVRANLLIILKAWVPADKSGMALEYTSC